MDNLAVPVTFDPAESLRLVQEIENRVHIVRAEFVCCFLGDPLDRLSVNNLVADIELHIEYLKERYVCTTL